MNICPKCKSEMRPVGFFGHILRWHCDKCQPLEKHTWSKCSWNPPKPKTVMVELTIEQAELGAKLGLTTDIASACRKALEEVE